MEDLRFSCNLVKQGLSKGVCEVNLENGSSRIACKATLKYENDQFHRVISAMHLSRPEDYFSIYQSGCNHSCLKCHSWEFSKHFNGEWYSTDEIAEECKQYEKHVSVFEPRERALMYYANKLCKHCGSCILYNRKSPLCPNKLSKDQILLGPQGFGPARNIVAFTGGDIACQAEFYCEVTQKIKERCENLWVLLETNGYGLTPKNLDLFQKARLDSYWLDIKAFDADIYKKLCGTTNKTVLNAPKEMIKRNFVLEILTVYIPNFVEIDQFELLDIDFENYLRTINPKLRKALEIACERIYMFHESQPIISWMNYNLGGQLGQIIKPIKKIGIYIPGGKTPLFSSILMAALPAVVAGTKEIIFTSPPNEEGTLSNIILATFGLIKKYDINMRIFRIGGAQAIAAMAFGTEQVPRVDKIVGPGNIYVTLAKKEVYGTVGIDGIYGPTEALVIADENANPSLIASDLLAQAEHDILAIPILVTSAQNLISSVKKELERQIINLKRKSIIKESIQTFVPEEPTIYKKP